MPRRVDAPLELDVWDSSSKRHASPGVLHPPASVARDL